MSGIAGILHRRGAAVEKRDLSFMAERLAHRGPDNTGLWQDSRVGLIHMLLRTTPEAEHEQQPLVASSGAYVITADARIDNRAELLAFCNLAGRPASEIGDSELILAAYDRWGEECARHLLGDFAFAIWDRRRRRLFCARDQIGVRQFYYYCAPSIFVFGSEISAIMAAPGVIRRLNEERLADILCGMFHDHEATLFEGVLRLQPAHTLVVDQEQFRTQRYWALDPERENRLSSDGEYAEAYRALFTRAVDRRLRSSAPLIADLSGGLDSSAVACVARDLLAERSTGPLSTFSIIFDKTPSCDESHYIQAVVDRGGITPSYVSPDQGSMQASWMGRSEVHDEPIFNPQFAAAHALYRRATAGGVRVQLQGVGGDEVAWHGFGYLFELLQTGRLIRLWREARDLRRVGGYSPWPVLYRRLRLWLPDPLRDIARRVRGRAYPRRSAEEIIRPEFARRVVIERRRELNLAQPAARNVRQEQLHSLTRAVGHAYLYPTLDRTAALFGVEPRYPFLDRELIEFCLALPAGQKMSNGWTRSIARRALAGVLPEEVRWRKGKADLSASVDYGLLTYDRPILDEVISDPAGRLAGYVDMSVLRAIYDRYLARRNSQDGVVIWRAATLGLWLRQAFS